MMSKFQERKSSGNNNNRIGNYYRREYKSKKDYKRGNRRYNSDDEGERPATYYNTTIRGTVFRGLHVIFTVDESEANNLDWIKDFGIVESCATHTGCDRGGLHSHVLLLAHCRKDKTVIWNFKKLYRSYFNNHGDVECEGCERLAKYGRSSKCGIGECNRAVTIIQINDEEHWKNCVRYITEREDGRSDVEPEDEEVEKCSQHRNDDPYCGQCAEYKLSKTDHRYKQRRQRRERSTTPLESEEDEEEEIAEDV